MSAGAGVAPARRKIFTILLVAAAAAAGILMGGFQALVLGPFVTGAEGIHRIHDLGWGLLVGLFMAIGLFAQLRRPETKPAAMHQVVLALLAFTGGSIANGEPIAVAFIPILVAGLLVLLHPGRREVLRPALHPSPLLGSVALLGGVAWAIFAADQWGLQRNLPTNNPHVRANHFAIMTVMAVCVIAVSLLTSLRPAGWRVPAWSAGVAHVAFGMVSLYSPSYESSAGTALGVILIAFGIAFVALAEREGRRVPASPAPPVEAAQTAE